MSDETLTFFTPAAWPENEAARQARVDEIDYEAAAADPRLAEIVARTAELFGSTSAVVSIVSRNRQNWIVRFGTEHLGTARAVSFCGHVVATPADVVVVPDAAQDPRFAGNPLVTAGSLRFYTGAALLRDGMAIGALCTVDAVAHPVRDEAAEAKLVALAAEASDILSRYVRTSPPPAA